MIGVVARPDKREEMPSCVSLGRNRDFNLLLAGQVVSDLGARVSGIAFPLLTLGLTGSPAKAGLVAFAQTLPLLVLTLPAGALVDRADRKRVMVVADCCRCLALASLVLALALDRLAFAHVVLVALVDGIGFVFFNVGERSALRSVVPDRQLGQALARNQSREYTALLAGPPLGGALFALGRLVPFVFDAASYAASVVTLLLIRAPLSAGNAAPNRSALRDVRDGLAWFWHQPFVRVTSVLSAGSDFTLNGLYLVIIVLAQERGASAPLVGAMFAFLGVGGLLGSLAAPFLARRLSMRGVVAGTQGAIAALLPLLIVAPGRVAPGVVYGAMVFLLPTWNATVGAYRLKLAPLEMQGRVASVATLLSLGPASLAALLTGMMLQATGTTPTIIALFVVMALVAATAVTSRSVSAVSRSTRDSTSARDRASSPAPQPASR